MFSFLFGKKKAKSDHYELTCICCGKILKADDWDNLCKDCRAMIEEEEE